MTSRQSSIALGQILESTLNTGIAEPEVDRILIAGALVLRTGAHFRIECGADSWDEIEAQARRMRGQCDCGAPLSTETRRRYCRSCGQQFYPEARAASEITTTPPPALNDACARTQRRGAPPTA